MTGGASGIVDNSDFTQDSSPGPGCECKRDFSPTTPSAEVGAFINWHGSILNVKKASNRDAVQRRAK